MSQGRDSMETLGTNSHLILLFSKFKFYKDVLLIEICADSYGLFSY